MSLEIETIQRTIPVFVTYYRVYSQEHTLFWTAEFAQEKRNCRLLFLDQEHKRTVHFEEERGRR